MSSPLAIASVTHILKDLLNNGVIDHDITGVVGTTVLVTALPPDRVSTDPEASQLNLFMYQATENQGWRNQGFPSFNSSGDRIANPPLALDLHYLLMAYGAEELHHEILLGYGMQLFHETPVLSRDAIRRSLALPTSIAPGSLPPNLLSLATSELADQIEQIKITPETLNAEDISRLWTAFATKYRPNAAYKVTVVLIESKKSTIAALPVRERKIYVTPLQTPVIEKISSQTTAGAPIVENQKILFTSNLVIIGTQLKADFVTINIDGLDITPAPANVSDTQIIIPIPTDLQPGIHSLQVVHKILMGSPPSPHSGVSSNLKTFVLSPAIQTITVSDQLIGTNGLWSATLALTIKPAVSASQKLLLLLNEMNADPLQTPVAYSFQATAILPLSPPIVTEDITIPIMGVKNAKYLVRIQVDGAESPLHSDAAFNFNDPTVMIP